MVGYKCLHSQRPILRTDSRQYAWASIGLLYINCQIQMLETIVLLEISKHDCHTVMMWAL